MILHINILFYNQQELSKENIQMKNTKNKILVVDVKIQILVKSSGKKYAPNITIFKQEEMKRNRDQDDLSPHQYNEMMLNQQKCLQQTIQSQGYLIDELTIYLQSLESSLQKQTKELQNLQTKNHNVGNKFEDLRILIEKQGAEERELEAKRSLEISNREIAIRTAIEKHSKIKTKEGKLLKEMDLLDEQTQQICKHMGLLQNKLDGLITQNKKYEGQINKLKQQTKQIQDYIEDCYMNKKKLNNQLQQLRGNIRVYCRIRPFLHGQQDQSIYELINENTLKIKVPKQNQKSDNHLKDYIFNFQQIFDMKENQENVFNQLCQLIQSAVDGKNVCIFAYGQTGSGKTHTMQGGEQLQAKGIIPRTERARSYQWESEISISIQEVYLEGVRDLLSQNKIANTDENAKKYVVHSPVEVFSMLEEASRNRKVAETSCNEHSSRSHLIFTIHIVSRSADKKTERRGSLNLVDLAGSERVALSKVEGQRMKETQAINKSLTNLGIVISALAKKEQHIPFRNSRLTFLLQRYLQGDSKTLMFVNISPKTADYNQTICSLRFAEKVKECKLKK